MGSQDAEIRSLGQPTPSVGGYSRCLAPLLATTFHRFCALPPPLPENRMGEVAPEALPPAASPELNVLVGSLQLSRIELQLVPLVGAPAVLNTPWARLSEP